MFPATAPSVDDLAQQVHQLRQSVVKLRWVAGLALALAMTSGLAVLAVWADEPPVIRAVDIQANGGRINGLTVNGLFIVDDQGQEVGRLDGRNGRWRLPALEVDRLTVRGVPVEVGD